MAGVKQFTQFATVSLSASSVSMLTTPTTAIASGGSEQVVYYAAVGTIIRPSGIGLVVAAVPSAAGTNTHSFYIIAGPVNLMGLTGKDNTQIAFRGSCVVEANDSSYPTLGQPIRVGDMIADSVSGLELEYINDSSLSQTSERYYQLAGVQEAIV